MRTLFILIYVLSFISIYGQRFRGGVVIGVSGNQIDGDGYSGYNKFGYELGVYSDYVINRNFSLRSGVFYVTKGSHSPPKASFFRVVISEIEVPFIVNYQPYPKLGVSIGLTFNYVRNAFLESTYVLNKDDLGVGDFELSYYVSLNYKIAKNLEVRFGQRYGLIPITRPIKLECWKQTMFLSWLYAYPYTNYRCWWTNSAFVSLNFKLVGK